jgi:hypothetical protein
MEVYPREFRAFYYFLKTLITERMPVFGTNLEKQFEHNQNFLQYETISAASFGKWLWFCDIQKRKTNTRCFLFILHELSAFRHSVANRFEADFNSKTIKDIHEFLIVNLLYIRRVSPDHIEDYETYDTAAMDRTNERLRTMLW